MSATPGAYRPPYVSQMLSEPDRTWDDCAASVGLMLAADWTLGEVLIKSDGSDRNVLWLRNAVRAKIGDKDGGLTFHDVNDILHVLDKGLPDLPRYNGQGTKPGQSTAGASLRLDRGELKALLMSGHSAGVCGYSGTVGHVILARRGNAEGPIVLDPLTRHLPRWQGERWTWSQLWAFTERKVDGDRFGSPDAIACAVVRIGEQTKVARMERAKDRTIASKDKALSAAASTIEAQRARIVALESQEPQDCSTVIAERDAALRGLQESQAALVEVTAERDDALAMVGEAEQRGRVEMHEEHVAAAMALVP